VDVHVHQVLHDFDAYFTGADELGRARAEEVGHGGSDALAVAASRTDQGAEEAHVGVAQLACAPYLDGHAVRLRDGEVKPASDLVTFGRGDGQVIDEGVKRALRRLA